MASLLNTKFYPLSFSSKNKTSMNYLKVLLFITFASTVNLISAQDWNPPMTKTESEQTYKWRIQQTELAGQYIPKDLFDAIEQLNKLTEESSRIKFKNMSEYDAEHRLYFSLGRWVATNWGFYEGSRLSHYLKEVGITFPEDQATAIILAWHRALNKKDINFKQIRDNMVEKRRKEREARLNGGEVIKEEIKKPAPNRPKN
jgi:hypothetical protein